MITINYYKEHYGIRSSSSQNIPSKLEKEHKVTNTAERTEEEKENNILKKNIEITTFLTNILKPNVPDVLVKIKYNKETGDRDAYLITKKPGIKPSAIVVNKIKQELNSEQEINEIIVIDEEECN